MSHTSAIETGDLPPRFLDLIKRQIHEGSGQDEVRQIQSEGIRQQTALVQAKAIQDCLDRYGHDVNGKKKTAEKLGISLRTLYRKLGAIDSA